MAHEVVRLADQLLAGEAADLDKGVIAVADLAVEVGGGNQAFVSWEGSFPLSHRQVLAHQGFPVRIGIGTDV